MFLGSIAPQHPQQLSQRQQATLTLLTLYIFSIVFLQKIAVPIPGGRIDLIYATTLLLSVYFFLSSRATLDVPRVCAYGIFLLAVSLSQALTQASLSSQGLALALTIHIPWLFVTELSKTEWCSLMRRFQIMMLVVTAIVFGQLLLQGIASAELWPNLDKLLPNSILVADYNYMRETGWQTGKYLPNGIFFLEPSILSQFLVLSIVIEMVTRRTYFRLLILLLALFLTQAGTGLLILALASPLLLMRLSFKAIIAVSGAAAVVLLFVVASGAMDLLAARSSELLQPGTSGYMRYTAPVLDLISRSVEPGFAYTGIGAGNIPWNSKVTSLGLTKLAIEYGMFATLSFSAFLLLVVYKGAVSVRLATVALLIYLLGGGGFPVPIFSAVLWIMAGFLRLAPGPVMEPVLPEPNRAVRDYGLVGQ